MAQQINVNIRMDKNIKEQADILFNDLGFNLTTAVNAFVRQALRDRAIPFRIEAKTAEDRYNEYFNPYNMNILKESMTQAEQGKTVSFTMAELEAMENGEIPQRAIDFMETQKKAEGVNDD